MVESNPTNEAAAQVAAAAPQAPQLNNAEAASAPAVIDNQEEEKKGEDADEPEYVEIAPDANLSEIFVNLSEGVPSDVIESLCMECKKNGQTRFMYTKIPMFKEIILSSFTCEDEDCGFKNNEVQFGGKLADYGCKYNLAVINEDGLNRSVVKSEFATIRIPELDFEIPPQTQKGSIKTVEGYLLSTIEGLEEMQEERRKFNPQVAAQIDEFIEKMKAMREGRDFPFNFEVNDPSGNSFIQNPDAPNPDIACTHDKFLRSVADYQTMGYNVDDATKNIEEDRVRLAEGGEESKAGDQVAPSKNAIKQTAKEQDALLAKVMKINETTKQAAFAQRDYIDDDAEITANLIDFSKPVDDISNTNKDDDVKKEVMNFPSPCPSCFNPGMVKMCCATIPFFKEIIIMAYTCDICGHRSTEIKQGGGMNPRAAKITFHVQKMEDINRDIFKSDTCELSIPEVDFVLTPGTLGSCYTTVEGMLQKAVDQLQETNPFNAGDSAQDAGLFGAFIDKVKVLIKGETPFTLIMDDPLSNCFIYNPTAPLDDPQIEIEVYDRTEEQNDELGITQMVVE